MRSTLAGLAAGAAITLVSGLAGAGLVVGNDQSGTATIYHIDVESGLATPIYSNTTADAKMWGMAYDPGTNTLYWNNGGNLYSSPFSDSLTPSAPVAMTFNGANTNFVGLAWRDGILLGTRNISTEAVYQIDPTTGVATQLFVYSSALDFGGLDVDATTGTLYGLSDTSVIGLHEIDVVGMSTTLRAPYPSGESDIDGLAVYNGIAYYVTDGPNTTQANFYIFDIASGTQTGTIPSPFTGSGTFCAAAFVPDSAGTNGACCAGATCSVTSPSGCAGSNTSFAGAGTVCNVPGDNVSPCCKADFNHVNGVTVQDIFDFLTAYFTSSPQADISGGGVSVQDIFDFLTAYFRGCT